MNLLTGALLAALRRNNADRGADHIPLVKFFVPWGAGTWIITEMEDDGDTLFGLAEIHEPELGYSSLAELEGVRASRWLADRARSLVPNGQAPFGVDCRRQTCRSNRRP